MVVETTSPVWKTGVLPLNYIRISGGLPPTTYFASYIALPQATYHRPFIGIYSASSSLVGIRVALGCSNRI